MPVSQGSVAIAPTGMTLKAYALFTATAGGAVIVKSSGIASITRTGLGVYTAVFSSAMVGTAYMVQGQPCSSQNLPNAYVSITSKTTAQATLNAFNGGSPFDFSDGVYVAFYE